MAKRTINRVPRTSDTDLAEDIADKYANFASSKGLCDDQNYFGVDQETFEDANNMYVDGDGQLSSRPKLIDKTIDLLPSQYTYIYKMVNVHNVMFYHVNSTNDTKYVIFKKDNNWLSHVCGNDISIGWFQDKFYFFTNNSIFAYSYDEGWLGEADIIYRPITTEIRNGVIETYEDNATIDAPNIFGGGEVTRYFYSQLSNVNWDELIGKTITLTLNGQEMTMTFVKNTELTFVEPLIKKPISDAVTNDSGQIIAWNVLRRTTFYYSPDGQTFITLPTIGDFVRYSGSSVPTEHVVSYPVLSQDGSKLYLFIEHLTYNSGVAEESYTIYYMTLVGPDNIALSNYVWGQVDSKLNSIYVGNNRGFVRNHNALKHNIELTKIYGYCNDGSDDRVVFIRTDTVDNSVWASNACQIFGYTIFTLVNNGSNGMYTFNFFVPVDAVYGIDITDDNDSQIELACATRSNTTILQIKGASFRHSQNRYYYDKSENGLAGDNLIHSYVLTLILDSTMKPYVTKQSDTADVSSLIGITYVIDKCEGDLAVASDINYTSPYIRQVFMRNGGGFCGLVFSKNASNFNATTSIHFKAPSAYAYISADNVIDSNSIEVVQIIQAINATSNSSGIASTYGDATSWFTCDTISVRTFMSGTLTNETRAYKYSIKKYNDNYLILTNTTLYTCGLAGGIISSVLLGKSVTPISALCRDGILYTYDGLLYGKPLSHELKIDIVKTGSYNHIIPSFIEEFIDDVIAYDNKLNWNIPEEDSKKRGKLYFSKANELKFVTDITNMTILSTTELALFFENEIRILQYTDNGYRTVRSKLQLGCRKGYSVLLNYDGSTSLLCTIKGLTAISYQDFVQSTDQVFTYLSENITGMYEDYDKSPIKLYQYKNWITMYRQDTSQVFIYDLRNQSWWKWSFDSTFGSVQQVIYNGQDLIILVNGKQYLLANNKLNESYVDFGHAKIDWFFRSQKLHLGAPNNYKHVNQLLITSTQELNRPFVLSLVLTCYRNVVDMSDKVTYDYEVNGVKTFIKKTNFMKINAFQFEISNYDKENAPRQFATSNVGIKYRITERIR